eukprot:3060186-Prymnesium_polylepis.1
MELRGASSRIVQIRVSVPLLVPLRLGLFGCQGCRALGAWLGLHAARGARIFLTLATAFVPLRAAHLSSHLARWRTARRNSATSSLSSACAARTGSSSAT